LPEMSTTAVSDPADLSLDRLVDELATTASHLAAGMCRWLSLVREVDRRKHWAHAGRESCGAWLAWRCGLRPRSAREHVRVARRLAELPCIQEAFASGRLSYAKVRALTRVAEPESEVELLQLALMLTASQLERAIRAYRRVTAADSRELYERAHLELYWDDDGSLVVRGRLAPDDGAVLERALAAAADRLWAKTDDGSAGPRPTRAEALVAVAEASLSGGPARGGDRYQVVVHVDEDALAEDGVCAIDEGPAISSETTRRLACDASVVRIRERKGRPLSVGRKTRSVPAALRRALTSRDGRRCRFPGCENRFVDAHHIRHWARGGETSLRNLVFLCRRHHRFVHEGGYAVDENFRFYDPRGRPIRNAPHPPRGDPCAFVTNERGPSTLCVTWPDRMDLGIVVGAMARAGRREAA
jgi:Domain of unknown function (DUF222)/HNH endonuclease